MAVQSFHRAVVARKNSAPAEGVDADIAYDLTGETPTSALTTGILDASKIGGASWTTQYVFGGSHSGVVLEHTTIETDATVPDYSADFNIGGTPYSGSGDLVIVSDWSYRNGNDNEYEGWKAVPPGGTYADEISTSCFIKFSGLGTSGDEAYLDLITFNQGGNYVVSPQMRATDAPIRYALVHTDGDGGGVYGNAAVITNQWYLCDSRVNITAGYGEGMLRDPSTGAIVLAGRWPTAMTGTNSINFFTGYLDVWGGDVRYTPPVIALDANAIFPLSATPTMAAPTAPVAEASDVDVTLTLSDLEKAFTFQIQRNKNSGGWVTVETDWDEAEYVDTDVTTSDVLKYRVAGKINAYISGYTESNEVTVVSGTWTDSVASGSTNTDDTLMEYSKFAKVVAPASGNCTKIRYYIGEFSLTVGIKLALYDGSFNRLAQASGTVTGSGQIELSIASTAVTSSATYYIGAMIASQSSAKGRFLSGQASGSAYIDFSGTYGAFAPATMPSGDPLTWKIAAGMYII